MGPGGDFVWPHPRLAVWAGGLAMAALLVTGLTFHSYRFSSSGHAPRDRKILLWSPSEADRRALSAQAYLKDHPEDLEALTELAIAYFSKGPDYYVDGMNALERARTLGAVDVSLFYYAGVMYDGLGLPDYAINDLKRYLRHVPGDYEASVRLGNVYFRRDQIDEAYAMYRQAIAAWPKDPTVLFNYAVVATKKGDYDAAEKALADVERLAGRLLLGGLHERGEIQRLKGDEAAAIASYQQELAANPDYLPSLEALESIFRKKGDFKAARGLKSKIKELKLQHG